MIGRRKRGLGTCRDYFLGSISVSMVNPVIRWAHWEFRYHDQMIEYVQGSGIWMPYADSMYVAWSARLIIL